MTTGPETITIRLKDGRLFENVRVCRTFFERLRGFLFRKTLRRGEMLFFPRCNSVHTFFMIKELHVLFLDDNMNVVREIKLLKPFRVAYGSGAKSVLEIVE
jgi:uncharacterized protein